MYTRIRLITLLLAISFILSACSPASADGPGSLVVYSGRSESLVAPIIEQFSEATGIKVEVRYGSTSEIAATLLEEGQNSPADVFFAQDPGGLGAIAEAGLLASLPQETLDQVLPRFRSGSNQWVGVSGRARVIVYNTEMIDPASLPGDIWDFTDPQWRGRIGWAPTNGSFQAMVTAMRAVWGEERTREWLLGIQANEPVAYENNTAMVEAAAAGEIEIGFTNHYYIERGIQANGPGYGARTYFLPGGGPGSLIMVAGIGQLQTAKNPENALKFINFLLSPVAQQYFAGQTFEYPVIEGVNISASITPLDQLNGIDIDLTDLSDLQGTVALLNDTGILP